MHDYSKVDGEKELSDAWTGFTRFIVLKDTTGWIYTVREGRLTRKQTNSRHYNVWPDMWKHMSDASKWKANQKWTIEKPKLDNARQLRGIFFIEPDDGEFKHTMKNARGKLDNPMPAGMLCKTTVNCRGENCRSIGKHKTEYACIVDADESMRIRMEGSHHKNHEDHIAGKPVNSMTHYSLVHKLIPMPEALKLRGAKAAVEKEWENWRKYRHGSRRKSGTKVRWSLKQGMKAEKFISRHWWISVILRIRSWNHNFKNIKVELYSEVTLWKMIQDHAQYFLNKDHQLHKWRHQK